MAKIENVIDETRLGYYHDQLMTSVITPLATATLHGSYKVVSVTQDATVTESPAQGTEVDVIYTNSTQTEITLTIKSTATYKTPYAQDITLVIPAGGYCEANYSNIGGTIYVRGM